MNKLKDLPNQQGFEFVGITHSNERINFFIHNSLESGFIAIRESDRSRVYEQLKGWIKHG